MNNVVLKKHSLGVMIPKVVCLYLTHCKYQKFAIRSWLSGVNFRMWNCVSKFCDFFFLKARCCLILLLLFLLSQRCIFLNPQQIGDEDLRRITQKSFERFDCAEVIPVLHLNGCGETNGIFIAELWHGPTLAFKDLAMQVRLIFFSFFRHIIIIILLDNRPYL